MIFLIIALILVSLLFAILIVTIIYGLICMFAELLIVILDVLKIDFTIYHKHLMWLSIFITALLYAWSILRILAE